MQIISCTKQPCNRYALCFLWGKNRNFTNYLNKLSALKCLCYQNKMSWHCLYSAVAKIVYDLITLALKPTYAHKIWLNYLISEHNIAKQDGKMHTYGIHIGILSSKIRSYYISLISIHSYFKLDVNKTTHFTKNSIHSRQKKTTAYHEIVPFLRYISPMNSM
jgi:hypothetical protein